MKKAISFLVFAFFVAGSIFAQKDKGNIKHWISGDLSAVLNGVGFSPKLTPGGSLRYEFMFIPQLSIGANIHYNKLFRLWDFNTTVFLRYYFPVIKEKRPFFAELGLGFGLSSYCGAFDHKRTYSYKWEDPDNPRNSEIRYGASNIVNYGVLQATGFSIVPGIGA